MTEATVITLLVSDPLRSTPEGMYRADQMERQAAELDARTDAIIGPAAREALERSLENRILHGDGA